MTALIAMTAMMAAPASAQGAPQPLKSVIDAVVQNGPVNQLPAHLSLVLGLNEGEQGPAVKQAAMRDGTLVRTFNVRIANHDDVVMMAYDEQSRSMKAYLVSAKGKLRKAVAYQAGAPATERSAAEARGDFANEIKFWTETAHLPAAAK
ncbi:MAG TPA: hypothetical protein VII35_00625 [Steroidobacteraceae bacterium]